MMLLLLLLLLGYVGVQELLLDQGELLGSRQPGRRSRMMRI